MSRLSLLFPLLALAACAAPPAPIEPHPISDACRGSFSAPCLRPYVEAAKRDAAAMELHPGSAGASIAPPSMTYGPIPPPGFLGATPVIVIDGGGN